MDIRLYKFSFTGSFHFRFAEFMLLSLLGIPGGIHIKIAISIFNFTFRLGVGVGGGVWGGDGDGWGGRSIHWLMVEG